MLGGASYNMGVRKENKTKLGLKEIRGTSGPRGWIWAKADHQIMIKGTHMRSVRVINRPKRPFLSFFSFHFSLFPHTIWLLSLLSPATSSFLVIPSGGYIGSNVVVVEPQWWRRRAGATKPSFKFFFAFPTYLLSRFRISHKKRNTRPKARNKKKSYRFLVIWFGFVCIGSAGSQNCRFSLIWGYEFGVVWLV